MSYHLTEIPKGTYGEFSKINEEFLEAADALNQDNPLMVLQELSDMLGAVEAYVAKYNITLIDLIVMKDATKRAFESGHRS
jgi:NTP pyrophosphatase (non-canonical NTP hydrolase)